MSDDYLRKAFAAGAEIFRSGDPGDCAYIVDEGEVEITIPYGARHSVVNRLGPGEIFGEMALIDKEARTASAIALGEVELIPIDRPMFQVLVRDDPDFAQTIINLLARRLRAAMNLLERQPGDRPRREGTGNRATA